MLTKETLSLKTPLWQLMTNNSLHVESLGNATVKPQSYRMKYTMQGANDDRDCDSGGVEGRNGEMVEHNDSSVELQDGRKNRSCDDEYGSTTKGEERSAPPHAPVNTVTAAE